MTDLYIQTYPLAQQIQFNSKLLKVGEQAILMDQLQELSIEELRAAIEIVRSRQKEQKFEKCIFWVLNLFEKCIFALLKYIEKCRSMLYSLVFTAVFTDPQISHSADLLLPYIL